MDLIDLLRRLQSSIYLLKDFDDRQLIRLLKQVKRVNGDAGDTLFKQGNLGHTMYVIISGQVKVLAGSAKNQEVLAVLGPGECLGEMTILRGAARSATAVFESDCMLLELTRTFFDYADTDLTSRMYKNMASILSERLRTTDSLVQSLSARRLGEILVDLGHITKEQLQEAMDVQREES